MSIIRDGKILCGKPTRRGGLCQLPLRGGKCPTHDSDLSSRNQKVSAAWRANNPDGFVAQRKTSGRAGFEKVGGEAWRLQQSEKARQWRLAHPSEPERWIIDVLLEHLALDVSYDREYVIDGDERAVDFAFPEQRCVIEVLGHQYKASFGESAARMTRVEAKIAWLESLDWKVHVVDASQNADRDAEKRRLLSFLSQHGLL